MKELIWLGGTLQRLRDFPAEAKRAAGEQLWRVQKGEEPEDWKPMPSVGAGAIEIRKTAQKDINKARTSYAEIDQKRKRSQTKE